MKSLIALSAVLLLACHGKSSRKPDAGPGLVPAPGPESCPTPQVRTAEGCVLPKQPEPPSPQPPAPPTPPTQEFCASQGKVLSLTGESCVLESEACPAEQVLSFDKRACLSKTPSFVELCEKRQHVRPRQRDTISSLLSAVKTQDCAAAYAGLPTLRKLYLSESFADGEGFDLALLKTARQLQSLTVSNTLITAEDLEPLQELNELRIRQLALLDEDLSLIAKLPLLQVLEIEGDHQFTTRGIETLASIQGLKMLSQSYPQTQVSLAPLAALPNLETLEIRALTDVDSVKGDLSLMTRIKELKLPHGVGIFEFLKDLKQLEKLDVGTFTADFEPGVLAGLGQLIDFRGGCVRPDCLSQLPQPANLKHLSLVRQDLATHMDIKDVGRFTGVERLIVSNSSQTDLSGVENLTKLKSLALLGGKISSLKGLENLTALESMFLTRSNVQELADLGLKPNLKSFLLQGEKDIDLIDLRGAPQLELLIVQAGTLQNAAVVGDMRELKVLTLSKAKLDLKRLEAHGKLEKLTLTSAEPDLRPLADLALLIEVSIKEQLDLTPETCPRQAASPGVATYCKARFPA